MWLGAGEEEVESMSHFREFPKVSETGSSTLGY